ncbi:ferrochelatase [Candidatus Hartigia pinicola]
MLENKYGILLVNLGTPEAPTTSATKRYLAEFLSDSRVIDVFRIIWKPILYGVILPYRSSKIAKLYQSIWMQEGSPLLIYVLRQKNRLSEWFPEIPIEIGMTYGAPLLKHAIEKLINQGITELIVLPLYPQYSSTTTGAVYDSIFSIFRKIRTIPSLHFIRSYAAHPAYIQGLVNSIKKSFSEYGEPDRLILSFHGIPKRYIDSGDIYAQECEKTTLLLKTALNFPKERVLMTYQSRFTCEAWLSPYTNKIIQTLPSQGVKSIQVICPGFSADCLETLEEINQQNRYYFKNNGGEFYHYIPALNDSDDNINLFRLILKRIISID